VKRLLVKGWGCALHTLDQRHSGWFLARSTCCNFILMMGCFPPEEVKLL
jgi:hypothetical protein